MKKSIASITSLFILMNFSLTGVSCQDSKKDKTIKLIIDGSFRFQKLDGIGVNANTSSWNGDELKPALDKLIDTMHANIWRVVVESVEKWEDVNDNDDPFTFNWDYYNKLYETPKFQKAWDMIGYLNRRGITGNLMIEFMGFAPKWMGIKVIEPKYEQEFVEMIVSFFYYAIKIKGLKIGLIGPTNESDWYKYSEGPHLNGRQLARIIRMMIDRMEALGIMGNIKIVAPDVVVFENAKNSFIPALMDDPIVWSKIAHLGFHSYGGYSFDIQGYIKSSPHPDMNYWMTEYNAWCDGCDDGKIGSYDYKYACRSFKYLLEFLSNGAQACLIWEAYDSYYEHHAPSPFSWWGILGYDKETGTYTPRKHFYATSQVSGFIPAGSRRISATGTGDSMKIVAFHDSVSGRITITGINESKSPVALKCDLANLPEMKNFEMIYTNSSVSLHKAKNIRISNQTFTADIPADCIFTLTGTAVKKNIVKVSQMKPEPDDWIAGDMHVHVNCGDATPVTPEDKLVEMMETNDLGVISVLADMGNAEVKDAKNDLLKVTGKDALQPSGTRTVYWDAEWHWDATYSDFEHQALGGHLVLLGLNEAHQIWDESPYKILEWAKDQGAISGFCHLQYLNDTIQNELNCCIPVDYPVEVALGSIDFIAEDVYGTNSPNSGTYNADATINAYYRLLNCGFRPGLAAGTDFPCNNSEPLGTLLTYVKVKGPFSYRKWIEGIKNGNTVVSRNGHREFIDLKVNGKFRPGDEIKAKNKISASAEVTWTAIQPLTGRLELVSNGNVIASREARAMPGEPVILKANPEFLHSGWICGRRMDVNGHQTHTAPVYITVNNAPVRADAPDAIYFVKWIDNILVNIAPGGIWEHYFTHDKELVADRYRKAREVFAKIAGEAASLN